jgi:cell division protein FtsB
MTTDRSHRRSHKVRWIIVMNVVLFGLIGFGFGEEYLRNREIEGEIARMQSENAALQAQKLSSLSLIDTLSSSYYVEGEARQSGLGKDGEQLVIVQDDHGGEAAVAAPISHDDIPNPLRWYYFFFDHAQFDALSDV